MSAIFATRGRERAILIRGRVVPLAGPCGTTRAGDVRLDHGDLPLLLVARRPLIASCGEARQVRAGDAWRRIGDVSEPVTRAVLQGLRRVEETAACERHWSRGGGDYERAARA